MPTELKQYSTTEMKLLKEITDDPVKWAQVFVQTFDPEQKKYVPWIARWYQVQMLRDNATRRVARCGRRTGKTETMCIEMLWRIFTKQNYRCLVVTPYENQVRLVFMRLKELIDASPMLKRELDNFTRNPYLVATKNGSVILGFTTGASSGSGGASIRGQRADMIYMDEVDYMGDQDFDTVTTIAAERADIGIFMSSTPTGRRSNFYKACTDPKMGYKEHYHPSMHNPNWGPGMEAEFRAQLSAQGYVHEIEAEFGTQDTGVFNKDKIDLATQHECYAYNELDYYQLERINKLQLTPHMYLYPKGVRAPMNPFRTMGVDWDKYGASSSILILDFDVNRHKFKVIKRVEVPRGEYSYDNAINTIVELNDQYNPSWIYCDRGAGEYQIERLHIIGDQNKATNLKNKVKGWHFKNTIDVVDPISKITTKEPMKPFMVTQLQIAFEREMMMLSPFDEVLHKQLIDYEVEKVGANGNPIFTSVNEHFVDAFGLAFLAFVLEFPKLTGTIQMPESTSKVEIINKQLGAAGLNHLFNSINPGTWSKDTKAVLEYDKTELPGDRPQWVKVSPSYRSSASGGTWGSRASGVRGGSSSGGRRTW
jgi:replicative DNA helicase